MSYRPIYVSVPRVFDHIASAMGGDLGAAEAEFWQAASEDAIQIFGAGFDQAPHIRRIPGVTLRQLGFKPDAWVVQREELERLWPRPRATKPRPNQIFVNAWLLNRAKQVGCPIKQSDRSHFRQAKTEIRAMDTQVRAAFVALPDQYRLKRGAPHKSRE